MMNMRWILCLCMCCLSLACEQPDTSTPIITIISPEENATFSNGQTIDISVDIKDDVSLHTYSLSILTPDNGESKWTSSRQISAAEHSIQGSFMPDVKLPTNFLFRVEATDGAGNRSMAESRFQVQL